MSVLFTTKDQLHRPSIPKKRHTSVLLFFLIGLFIVVIIGIFWIQKEKVPSLITPDIVASSIQRVEGMTSQSESKRSIRENIVSVQSSDSNIPEKPTMPPVTAAPAVASTNNKILTGKIASSQSTQGSDIPQHAQQKTISEAPIASKVEVSEEGFSIVLELPVDKRSQMLQQAYQTRSEVLVSIKVNSTVSGPIKASVSDWHTLPNSDVVQTVLTCKSTLDMDTLITLLNARIASNAKLLVSPTSVKDCIEYPLSRININALTGSTKGI